MSARLWFRAAVVVVVVLVASVHAHAESSRRVLGYKRGKPVTIEVVDVGWAELELRTARSFLAMQQAAAAEGIELWVRSGFRTHESQTRLYLAWRAGWGNKAARPGHLIHQLGRALDLGASEGGWDWIARHARRFGFKRTVRGEPRHFEYTRARR